HAAQIAELYSEHADFVWRSLRRLGVPLELAEDALQDVFLIAQEGLATFEGRSTHKTWLFGIARHVRLRFHERAVRQRAEELSDELPDARAGNPDTEAAESEAVRRLYEILDQLDDDKRTVFVLAELEEMSAVAIGELLGISSNTVSSRLRLARREFNAAVAR